MFCEYILRVCEFSACFLPFLVTLRFSTLGIPTVEENATITSPSTSCISITSYRSLPSLVPTHHNHPQCPLFAPSRHLGHLSSFNTPPPPGIPPFFPFPSLIIILMVAIVTSLFSGKSAIRDPAPPFPFRRPFALAVGMGIHVVCSILTP